MGSEQIRGFLLMLIFSNFCVLLLSSSPLQQETLPSDLKQDKSVQVESAYKSSQNGVGESNTNKNAIKERVKFSHGFGHANGGGGSGSRPTNPGEGGGSSRTPNSQGGTTFIPVYAAGAVNNRHPTHRGAANSNPIGASTIVAAATASFIHLYLVLRRGFMG